MQSIVGGSKNVLLSVGSTLKAAVPDSPQGYSGVLEHSFIGGGEGNVISGSDSIIGGGYRNKIGLEDYVPHGNLSSVGEHEKALHVVNRRRKRKPYSCLVWFCWRRQG